MESVKKIKLTDYIKKKSCVTILKFSSLSLGECISKVILNLKIKMLLGTNFQKTRYWTIKVSSPCNFSSI